MADLIDRQAALDVTTETVFVEYEDGDPRKEESIILQTKAAIRDRIKALPPVQPKGTKLSTVCLLCKKPAVTFNTDDDIPYTNYSYCEDCLRKGLKLLKKQIKALPPVQPNHNADVSKKGIIHCKDCKWYSDSYYCNNLDVGGFQPDDFCSLAERRGGTE